MLAVTLEKNLKHMNTDHILSVHACFNQTFKWTRSDPHVKTGVNQDLDYVKSVFAKLGEEAEARSHNAPNNLSH